MVAELYSASSSANTCVEQGTGAYRPSVALKFVASYKLPPGGGDFLYKETAEAQKKDSRYL